MIINKSSYERGFSYGCVYKSVDYSYNTKEQRGKKIYKKFNKNEMTKLLDKDSQ